MLKSKTLALVVSSLAIGSLTVGLTGCGSTPKAAPEATKPVSVVVGTNAPAPTPAPVVAVAPTVAPAPVAAPSPVVAAPAVAAKEFKVEAGMYRCEDQQSVAIKRINDGGKSVIMGYKGKDYELTKITTETGALRFENPKVGFAWIQVVGSALLLDTKRGSRIANKCVL